MYSDNSTMHFRWASHYRRCACLHSAVHWWEKSYIVLEMNMLLFSRSPSCLISGCRGLLYHIALLLFPFLQTNSLQLFSQRNDSCFSRIIAHMKRPDNMMAAIQHVLICCRLSSIHFNNAALCETNFSDSCINPEINNFCKKLHYWCW